MKHTFLALSLLTLLAACGDDKTPSKPATPNGTAPNDAAAMDDHGAAHELGEVAIAGFKFTAIQFGDIAAGKDAAFDFQFAEGTSRPESMYGWIGKEDGTGSRRARFENELRNKMHGHLEVPEPLPEGSKLWLEIELDAGPARGSIALHR